ncbi:dehydrogenase [Clostridium zeae]|uniref:Dehydrogenase n=1 Tax=Clostridium zeae TaxID=2759022 RepID=A0ABQ1E954_9CLOT|nr:molybdopterin-dependent oxidoreductase [Clostridium zeae]GFZ31327.1 dehydrogenase [Clostridium zeae]
MGQNGIRIVNTVCSKNCFATCPLKVYVKDDKVIKVEGNDNNPITRGKICAKGRVYPEIVNSEERLLYPLKRTGVRGEGIYEKISWDEALDLIYINLDKIRREDGPEAVLYYQGSGNFGVMRKYAYSFWHQFGGYTGTIGDLCDPAAEEGMKYTYGWRIQNSLQDLLNSKLIIVWGGNPAHTNIHAMSFINEAVRNGSKLVTIDPRKNESSSKSTLHIYPRGGTDGLLAIGIAKLLVENNITDNNFIEQYTLGFEKYKALLKEYTIEEVCRLTEVPLEHLNKLVELIKENPKYAMILGYGFQRYTNGGQTIRAVSLLPAITGSIGEKGCGIYAGESQGGMLKWPYLPEEPTRVRLRIPKGRLASEIEKIDAPKIKAMWVEKANPLNSNPNVGKLKATLDKLDFIVVTDSFLTDTSKYADLVLPAASFLEEDDLVAAYGHPYIQLKQKTVSSPGQCKKDREIYRLLGEKFKLDMKYFPKDDVEILSNVIKYSRLNVTVEEMKNKPYIAEDYDEIAFRNKDFKTASGKIEFYSEDIFKDWGVNQLPVYEEPFESKYSSKENYLKYPLQLITAHALERINSQFTESKRLNDIFTPVIHINSEDAKVRNIDSGDMVKVYNHRGEVFVKAKIIEGIKPGAVNIFEGLSEKTKVSVNHLIEDMNTDMGFGASYHTCLVEVQKLNK